MTYSYGVTEITTRIAPDHTAGFVVQFSVEEGMVFDTMVVDYVQIIYCKRGFTEMKTKVVGIEEFEDYPDIQRDVKSYKGMKLFEAWQFVIDKLV